MTTNSPIVIDSKPDYTRAGLSSGDTPTVIFQTDSVVSNPPMGFDGVVTNWDSMTAVLSHTFKQLGIDPSQHPILITEPPLNPKLNREKMTQIFFETFNVTKLYMIMGEILALYDAGKTTGTTVYFSKNSRFVIVVPSYQGYAYSNGIIHSSFDENNLSDREIQKISDMIFRSINQCDLELRSDLFQNIILTGSIFPELAAKLKNEVVKLALPVYTANVSEITEPENGAWRGGDKFAPLLDDYGTWMTKQEYTQYGATLVHRKCMS